MIFVSTPTHYFKEMLNTLNQTLIDGVLRYLMLLSSVGHQVGVKADYFFANPLILTHDIHEIIEFFSPTDADSNEIGLSKGQCQENSEYLLMFLQKMREGDVSLVRKFKFSQSQMEREIISRILYRRTTSDVDYFFDIYKTQFGGS